MKKIFIIFMLSLLLISCNKDNNQNLNTDKSIQKINENNKIYTSFYPIYFITKSLLGDYNVINLVPAGGEPHEYEPTLKQIQEMNNSKLVILNGLGIELYKDKLIKNIKTPIYTTSENLENLIKIDNSSTDPHIWLSPKMMKSIANNLSKELELKGFTKINNEIITKLDELDKKFNKELSNCKRNKIITSHSAFAYLARDYGFTQFAVLGISPEQEPSLKDIANIVDLIKKEKINVIFGEELVSPKFTNTIKQETNAEVLNLNPLETLTPEQEKSGENYISIMEKNLEYLKKGLDCK